MIILLEIGEFNLMLRDNFDDETTHSDAANSTDDDNDKENQSGVSNSNTKTDSNIDDDENSNIEAIQNSASKKRNHRLDLESYNLILEYKEF